MIASGDMSSAAGILLGIAVVLNGLEGLRLTYRQRRLELKIDSTYARMARRFGLSAQEIADELRRPTHLVSEWLETDPFRSERVRARIKADLVARGLWGEDD